MNQKNPTPLSVVAEVAVAIPAPPPNTGLGRHDRHLRTDHLRGDLKRRTVSSGAVTLVAQGLKFGLSLASTVILSRLLLPHDFGLLAMVTSLMNLLRIFKDAGLSAATIQEERITQAQVSNLFWVNVAVSGALSLILAGSAPIVSWFYREPQLVGITLWLAVTFLLSGSTVQHQALLRRQMRFKAIACIEVGSITAGLVTGALMALLGRGYWSLVGMNLAVEGTGFLLTWVISSWRPQLPKKNSGTRPLLKFGVSMTAGSALYTFSRGTDSLLLGRYYGADAVGLYTRAMALLMRPLEQLLSPVGAVFMPTLARLRTEPERYRRVFMQVYETMALVGLPSMALLLALSRPITLFLLGPKWESAAIIFSGFTLSAPIMPLAGAAAWLLSSQGRGKDYFISNVISSSAIVIAVLVGLPFGAVGVAFAYSGLVFVRIPFIYHIIGRTGPVSSRDLWLGLIRHLPLWAVVFVSTYEVRACLQHTKPIIQLLGCIPAGTAAALCVILLMPHQRAIAGRALGAFSSIFKRRGLL
jgi:PST family polysaccharide transporter